MNKKILLAILLGLFLLPSAYAERNIYTGLNVLSLTVMDEELLFESGFEFGVERVFDNQFLIGGAFDIRSSIITNILIYIVALGLAGDDSDVNIDELHFVEKTTLSAGAFLYIGLFLDGPETALRIGPFINSAMYMTENFDHMTTGLLAGGCLSLSFDQSEFRLGYLCFDISSVKYRPNNIFLGYTYLFE